MLTHSINDTWKLQTLANWTVTCRRIIDPYSPCCTNSTPYGSKTSKENLKKSKKKNSLKFIDKEQKAFLNRTLLTRVLMPTINKWYLIKLKTNLYSKGKCHLDKAAAKEEKNNCQQHISKKEQIFNT